MHRRVLVRPVRVFDFRSGSLQTACIRRLMSSVTPVARHRSAMRVIAPNEGSVFKRLINNRPCIDIVRFVPEREAIVPQFSARTTRPDNREMPLHIDQWLMPRPVLPGKDCPRPSDISRNRQRCGGPAQRATSNRRCLQSHVRHQGLDADERRHVSGSGAYRVADVPPSTDVVGSASPWQCSGAAE